MNAIGLAFAYASAIRTHLSVHGTAHPMSAACVLPLSEADCLICSAVDISHPRQQGYSSADLSAASGPVRSDITNGLSEGAVGGVGNPVLFPRMTTGAVPDSVDSTSVPLSSGHGNYLPTQSQASCCSASIGPLTCRPFSGFDLDNEEANVHANVDVAHGHANVHTSDIMMTNNDMTIMPTKVI